MIAMPRTTAAEMTGRLPIARSSVIAAVPDKQTRTKVRSPAACRFAARSQPKDLFELVRKEDVDRLMVAFPTRRLHYVASDGCALLLRDALDRMDDAAFRLYLDYHFATCERPDLLGVTSHALDIFQK